MSSEHLRAARLSILKDVAEGIGETCNIVTPDRKGITYLDRVETKWPLRIQLPIGTKVPFHCTASGKMYPSTLRTKTLRGDLSSARLERRTDRTITNPDRLLAELTKIRKNGYFTDDEEFMAGMAAVAVPAVGAQGRLLAVLAAHAPVQRHSLGDLVAFLPVLRRGAGKLAKLVTD